MSDMSEIRDLLKKQGEAYEAFKNSTALELAELKKRGAVDPVLIETIDKVQKTLDAQVEAKAAIEKAIEAERKEREELEAKLNRMNFSGKTEEGKRMLDLKSFNAFLQKNAAARGESYQPMDEAGYDAYKACVDRYMRKGREHLSADEFKTLSVGSDADGGFFVTPDRGGRIATKVYEASNIRSIASIQAINTDALEGIEDLDEAGAGYADERSTSGNTDTAQVGKWRIPVFWIDTEPKATQQLLDDAEVDIEAWHGNKVVQKFARFEDGQFVTGSAKIRGIVSYDVAADSGAGVEWGKIGYVASGASGAFAGSNPADKLYDLVGALKNEYLPNARWLTRRSVITMVRKFKDTTGQYLWQPSFVMGQPETLMGYAISRAEDMPALASDSLSLAFGDFRAAYQIVDRQGVRVLRDNLTSKPYVKFYTTKRVGGGVQDFAAIKLLRIAA